MKGLAVFVLVIVLAMTGYNWWQIQTLRQDIARLETKVAERPSSVSDVALGQALAAFERVRTAVSATDWNRARTAYDEARAKVDQVARAAGEKAGPTIDWLKSQTSELGKQLQAHMPR